MQVKCWYQTSPAAHLRIACTHHQNDHRSISPNIYTPTYHPIGALTTAKSRAI